MKETPNTDAKKRWPWLKIVLFASLALNLLVVGLIAGAALGKGPHNRSPGLSALGFSPFVRALPRADRDAIAEAFKQKSGSFQDNRRALRREFDAFLTSLRAETIDEAELRRLIESQGKRVTERRGLAQELVIERIVAMTPEARAEFADELDKAFKRRGPKPPKK